MRRMIRFLALILAIVVLCACPTALASGNKFHFDSSANEVFEGETLQTILVREGDCAADGTLTYVSSRPSVATVDAAGVVTGLKKGSTTITATLTVGKRTWRAQLTVNVARKVTSVEVREEHLPLYQPDDPTVAGLIAPAAPGQEALPVLLLRVGTNQSVTASLRPEDANNRRFELVSSDTTIVSAQSNTLHPLKAGECLVTVRSVQNPEVGQTYRALVVQPVRQLSIDAPEKYLYIGETLALTSVCTPADATIQDVTWHSGSEKIATVDASGVVTGVSRGNVTIKATAADGSGRTASISLTVRQQPTGISLSESAMTLNVGTSRGLRATVQPNNTTDKSVVWSSSDETVAKVNSSGHVTPVGPGQCVITCAAKDFPNVYAEAVVTVHQLVTSVAFTDKEISVNVGATVAASWQVRPANATDPSVTFSSNNTKVATVDADGVIYGVKRGTATITVTAQDGSKKRGTIKVSVLQPVEGVHMENDTLTVGVDESVRAKAVLEPSDASQTGMTWTSEDTSIATVHGSNTRPTVTGHRWGTTSIVGVTKDGNYVTTATVMVGNYDRALVITDLYVTNDKIRINVQNQSNMTITRFNFAIEVYDMYGQPLMCNTNGTNLFEGSYGYELYEGDVTTHGKFYFGNFVQPMGIGRVLMRITDYATDTGYSRSIRDDRQVVVEYVAPGYSDWGNTPNG